MQTQSMSQVKILIPTEWLSVVKEIVTRAGGQVSEEGEDLCALPQELECGAPMLKGMRKRARMTQADLAEKLKLPQSHISEFESGKRPIPYKHAQQLAQLFGLTADLFMRPNAETIEAMEEASKDEGKNYVSPQDYLKDLGI